MTKQKPNKGPASLPKRTWKKLVEVGVDDRGMTVFHYGEDVPKQLLQKILIDSLLTIVELKVKEALIDKSKPTLINPNTGKPVVRLKGNGVNA